MDTSVAPQKEVIGNAELWLGDCLEILPTLPKVDAVITDPPYGQAYCHSGGGRDVSNQAKGGSFTRHSDPVFGDDIAFDPSVWIAVAPVVLLFGAHKFSNLLPKGTWLIWDKVPTGKVRTFGDGEVAWLNDNPPKALRIIRHHWDGVCVADREDLSPGRCHPMQKPLAVMRWCIKQAGSPETILDPFMGSGTTGVACMQLGRKFIGIEIEPRYFEIACERIENAQRQQSLLDPYDTVTRDYSQNGVLI